MARIRPPHEQRLARRHELRDERAEEDHRLGIGHLHREAARKGAARVARPRARRGAAAAALEDEAQADVDQVERPRPLEDEEQCGGREHDRGEAGHRQRDPDRAGGAHTPCPVQAAARAPLRSPTDMVMSTAGPASGSRRSTSPRTGARPRRAWALLSDELPLGIERAEDARARSRWAARSSRRGRRQEVDRRVGRAPAPR